MSAITILLAEDDEFSRDLLTRRLQRVNFQVFAVPDGREAVRQARAQRPDLILMDLDMPVMDGRAAIHTLKTDPRTFRIPIIVLTAHTSPQDVGDAAAEGCEAFEAKPVLFRHLLERIGEVLKARGITPVPNAPAAPPDPAPVP